MKLDPLELEIDPNFSSATVSSTVKRKNASSAGQFSPDFYRLAQSTICATKF